MKISSMHLNYKFPKYVLNCIAVFLGLALHCTYYSIACAAHINCKTFYTETFCMLGVSAFRVFNCSWG